MPGIWYRQNSIYGIEDHWVNFTNAASFAIIRCLSISKATSDLSAVMRVEVSPFFQEIIDKLVEAIFSKDEYELGSRGAFANHSISIRLNSKTLNKIFQLLDTINKSYPAELDKELFVELESINKFLQEKDTTKNYQHIISDSYYLSVPHDMPKDVYYNPQLGHSTALVDRMNKFNRKSLSLREFKKLLIKGENPNQCDWRGDTPFKMGGILVR